MLTDTAIKRWKHSINFIRWATVTVCTSWCSRRVRSCSGTTTA